MTPPDPSQSPQASILIPLLNQVDAWLERAVLSAVQQTIATEVIVITSPLTGESNLRLLSVLQGRYANLRILCRPPNTAFAGALNLGIREATTSRVGFLMSDDWLSLEAVAACLTHDEDIVSTNRTFYAADGVTVFGELAIQHTPQAYRLLTRNSDRANFIEHFLLIRREAILRVGGVDESLGSSPGVDDFDMVWCLLEQGASVGIVADCLYHYRDHEGDRLTLAKREEMLATFNRILDKHLLEPGEREELLREHTPWFGKTIWKHYQTLAPLRPGGFWSALAQRLYRQLVSTKHRVQIHDLLTGRRPMTD